MTLWILYRRYYYMYDSVQASLIIQFRCISIISRNYTHLG